LYYDFYLFLFLFIIHFLDPKGKNNVKSVENASTPRLEPYQVASKKKKKREGDGQPQLNILCDIFSFLVGGGGVEFLVRSLTSGL